jgi:hypothetical protein
MDSKQLVSSATQRTCTSVVGGQKVSCQALCDGMGMLDFLLFPRLRSFLKGQRFGSAEEVTGSATRALTEVSKNCFQEYFQKLYERWQQIVTVQWNELL